jgi:hypothetical protein
MSATSKKSEPLRYYYSAPSCAGGPVVVQTAQTDYRATDIVIDNDRLEGDFLSRIVGRAPFVLRITCRAGGPTSKTTGNHLYEVEQKSVEVTPNRHECLVCGTKGLSLKLVTNCELQIHFASSHQTVDIETTVKPITCYARRVHMDGLFCYYEGCMVYSGHLPLLLAEMELLADAKRLAIAQAKTGMLRKAVSDAMKDLQKTATVTGTDTGTDAGTGIDMDKFVDNVMGSARQPKTPSKPTPLPCLNPPPAAAVQSLNPFDSETDTPTSSSSSSTGTSTGASTKKVQIADFFASLLDGAKTGTDEFLSSSPTISPFQSSPSPDPSSPSPDPSSPSPDPSSPSPDPSSPQMMALFASLLGGAKKPSSTGLVGILSTIGNLVVDAVTTFKAKATVKDAVKDTVKATTVPEAKSSDAPVQPKTTTSKLTLDQMLTQAMKELTCLACKPTTTKTTPVTAANDISNTPVPVTAADTSNTPVPVTAAVPSKATPTAVTDAKMAQDMAKMLSLFSGGGASKED